MTAFNFPKNHRKYYIDVGSFPLEFQEILLSHEKLESNKTNQWQVYAFNSELAQVQTAETIRICSGIKVDPSTLLVLGKDEVKYSNRVWKIQRAPTKAERAEAKEKEEVSA